VEPEEVLNLHADLTPEQLDAARQVRGPLLIIAGPGSGKTRVLTHRIMEMVSQGIEPLQILAITFTNKAADEMKRRVREFPSARGVWISTFHSWCSRMLRQMPDAFGYDENFTVYDRSDSLRLIDRLLAREGLGGTSTNGNGVLNRISRAKEKLTRPEDYTAGPRDQAGQVAQRIYPFYQQALEAANAVDFDDLLMHAASLLQEHDEFAEMVRSRFHYLLVDEYQDTNYAQYVIVSEIVRRTKNICVVGDPDQSIYGWRGAEIRNILRFQEDYPEATVIRLGQSFRSTQRILRAAGALVEHNRQHQKNELWTGNPEGEPIHVWSVDDEEDEAERVAEEIEQRAEGQTAFADFAVFYRTNAQSRAFEEVFLRRGVPYRVVAATAFYNRKEIKDILAYARTCANPKDDLSLRRIINLPPRGIGAVTLAALQNYAVENGVSLIEAVTDAAKITRLSRRARQHVEVFGRLWQGLRGQTELSVDEFFKKLLGQTGYGAMLQESGDEASEDRLANLDELINAAARYEERSESPTLGGFLEEISLVSDVDALDETADQVKLMTLHAAKGLEFPVVFLTGAEENLLPHQNSLETWERLEEERRLCYVGITRAIRAIFLSHAAYRMRQGVAQPRQPSRFLDEIPEDLTDAPERPSQQVERRATLEKRPPKETSQFHEGQRVTHGVFGRGSIISITRVAEYTLAQIRFDDGLLKKFVLEYAPLEAVSGGETNEG